MNKVLIILLLLTVSVGVMYAQMRFGGRAGLNLANVGGDNDMEDVDNRIGFHLGVMAQHTLMPNMLIQPELIYTNKGYYSEGTEVISGVSVDYEQTVKLDYIEIPLLIKYDLPMNNMAIQPYIGPSLGFLLLAEVEAEASANGISVSDTEDIKDETSSIDLGLNLGVDAIVGKNIMVGLRFNLGLINLDDSKDEDDNSKSEDEDPTYFNRAIMLNLGFLF